MMCIYIDICIWSVAVLAQGRGGVPQGSPVRRNARERAAVLAADASVRDWRAWRAPKRTRTPQRGTVVARRPT